MKSVIHIIWENWENEKQEFEENWSFSFQKN